MGIGVGAESNPRTRRNESDIDLMERQLLERILNRLPGKTVAVVGDFFLDKYLIVDPELDEPSIETGLTAHQVVGKRLYPGAAGTVAANLSALGVGQILAVGIIGRDGEGRDLKDGLERIRVNVRHLVETKKRMTPTYTKPMRKQPDGSETEMNRQDIKNRTPTPPDVEGELIERLRAAVAAADAVIVMDQVSEANCGVVTDITRAEIAALARAYPDTIFLGDSRERVHLFRNIYVKPNEREAARAAGLDPADADGGLSVEQVQECAETLSRMTGKPLFVTRGSRGILVYDGNRFREAPALRVPEPIDIVGAGDSASAAVVSALACGALLLEAAQMGNIAASVVIQQIGRTGTASPDQMRARWDDFKAEGLF